MRELDDSVGPEEAATKFSEYQQQLVERSVRPLRGSGLLFDLYHPLSALRRFDLRVRAAQRNAEVFLEDLKESRFAGLSLRAPAIGAPGRSGGTCRTTGHLRPPHFAFDPNVDAVLLDGIPPVATTWDVHDALVRCQGLAAISWPRPGAGGLLREVRARFASAGLARSALGTLAGLQPRGGEVLQPALVTSSLELMALVAPPEMSHPDRIQKDEALATRVVRLLDGLVGVQPELTEALLGREAEPEARLDLFALYLRRVHHFCLYAATWCEDEWDLQSRCGSALLRDAAEGVREGTWAAAHQQRLECFLATAKLERPVVLNSGDELVTGQLAAQLQAQEKQIAEGKFRCPQCTKTFRGPEYVQKHVRKVHPDIVAAVRKRCLDEAAWAACLADPNRPSVHTQGP